MKYKNYALKILLILLFVIVLPNTEVYGEEVSINTSSAIPQVQPLNIAIDNSLNNILCKGTEIDTRTLYREEKETVQVFTSNSRSVYITNSDIELMSKVVHRESRGEPFEGKVAVASVILNRAVNPKFPSTIEGVIKQKNAFSCVVNGQVDASPDRSCYEAVYEALKGIDPTNNSLFFYNPKISTSSWMKNVHKEDIVVIGNHVFFKK